MYSFSEILDSDLNVIWPNQVTDKCLSLYVTVNKHEMWVSVSAIRVFSKRKTVVNNLTLTFNEENMGDIYMQNPLPWC